VTRVVRIVRAAKGVAVAGRAVEGEGAAVRGAAAGGAAVRGAAVRGAAVRGAAAGGVAADGLAAAPVAQPQMLTMATVTARPAMLARSRIPPTFVSPPTSVSRYSDHATARAWGMWEARPGLAGCGKPGVGLARKWEVRGGISAEVRCRAEVYAPHFVP
jgi:hypothetical protein